MLTYEKYLRKLFPGDVLIKKDVCEKIVAKLMEEEVPYSHITSFAITAENTSLQYRHLWLSHASISRLMRAKDLLEEVPGLFELLTRITDRKKRS